MKTARRPPPGVETRAVRAESAKGGGSHPCAQDARQLIFNQLDAPYFLH